MPTKRDQRHSQFSPYAPTRLTRRTWLIRGLLGFVAIVLLSVVLALIGHSSPSVVVIRGSSSTPPQSSGFDWGLWALLLTGLGTTALALATGLLAYSTWSDVRASQEIAKEARNTNELARVEQDRRPELTLLRDEERIYSQVEGDGSGHVRLLVRNTSGRRAALGTRVTVPQYESWRKRIFTLGSPSLGWPSAPDAADGSLVIFAGSSRAIDLGILVREEIGPENDRVVVPDKAPWATAFDLDNPPTPPPEPLKMWCLRLALHGLSIADRREYLVASTCIVRMVVGADEAEAREYDVKVFWDGNAADAQAALNTVEITIGAVGAFA